MTTNHTTGRADILDRMFAELRTEIIRVRVSRTQKSSIASHAAKLGTRSATLAYELLMAEVNETNVAPAMPRRPEAKHRPLAQPQKRSNMFPGLRPGRGGVMTRRLSL